MKPETMLYAAAGAGIVLILLYYSNKSDKTAGGPASIGDLGPLGLAARETTQLATVLAGDAAAGAVDGFARGAGQAFAQVGTRFNPFEDGNFFERFLIGGYNQFNGTDFSTVDEVNAYRPTARRLACIDAQGDTTLLGRTKRLLYCD